MLKIKINDDVIYEFDPVIYPRKIWITVGCNPETLNKVFPEGGSDDRRFEDLKSYQDAVVHSVRKLKPKKQGGVLLWFVDADSLSSLEIITHECSHVASEIFAYIGAKHDVDNQEPFAYLTGFVGKCISEVINDRGESEK